VKRIAVVWLSAAEIQIPVALIPGAMAQAIYPLPDRNDSGSARPHDPDAVQRLLIEREQTFLLKQKFPHLPENCGMSITDVKQYLANNDLKLEVRRFGEHPTDSAASGKPSPPESACGGLSDTKRLVAWQAVLLENWPKIAECQKKPPAREVMRWLRVNGPRDVFPAESRPARNSLCWVDEGGGSHTLTISRLSTVLAEWRKAGKIPA